MKREERQKSIENKIIQAILRGLAEKELSDITAYEIAKNAEVSKRTLYKYFGSKTEMYLGLVKYCFGEVYNIINNYLHSNSIIEPLETLKYIGKIYLEYNVKNPVKGKIITSYNEQNFIDNYPKHVEEIAKIANSLELSEFLKLIYEKHNIVSKVRIESMTLLIWSNIIGLSTLILSKGSWIKQYYNIDESELIDANMNLLKSILLGETINERNN